MKKRFTKLALRRAVLVTGAITIFSSLNAQQRISDGTASAAINGGAILELQSTNKGLLNARVSLSSTTTWGLSGTAVNGMVVYNTNTAMTGTAAAPVLTGGAGLYYWDGTRWVGMGAGSGTGDFWRLKGNTATTPPATVGTATGAANYWGTADAQNLAVGTNGTTRAIFDQNGSLYGGSGTFNTALNPLQSLVWGSNNKDSANYTLLSGSNNTIGNAAVGSSVSGYSNAIVAGAAGSLISGNANKITNSGNVDPNANLGSNAVLGYNNTIDADGQSNPGGSPASHANIVAGNSLTSTSSADGALFGYLNTANRSQSYVMGGYQNKIYNLESAAVFGSSNKDSASFTLVAGLNNTVMNSSTNVAVSVLGYNNIARSAGGSIIGGNANDVQSTSSLVAGNGNTATGSGLASSWIVGGSSNNVLAGPNENQRGIVGGLQNTIRSTTNNTFEPLVTGANNLMDGGNKCAVIGASADTLVNATGVLMAGESNKAANLASAAIFGKSNKDSASYSLVSGLQNTLGAGATASVVSGQINNLVAAGYNNLVSGTANTITNSGNENAVSGISNTVGGVQNIVGGSNNTILGNLTSPDGWQNITIGGGNLVAHITSAAVFGAINKDSASYTLVAGQNNTLSSGSTHTMVTGYGNTLTGNNVASMVGGYLNNVHYADASAVSGSSNIVTGNLGNGSSGNAIVGGNSNTVFNGNASIVGGISNKDSANFNIVAGGNNVVAQNATFAALFGNQNSLAAPQGIVAGGSNKLLSTGIATAVFGHSHVVASPSSLVIGTTDSVMTLGEGNIIYGQQNYITGVTGEQNNLMGGTFNRMIGTNNATIVSGNSNIDSADYSFIAGSANRIRNGADYAVCVGENNTTTGAHGIAMGIQATAGANQMVVRFGAGSVTFDGTANWAFSSDRRLKHNIRPMSYGLAAVMKMKPSFYSYNGTEKPSMGFIAQDMQQVIPEVVGKNDDGMLNLKYTELIPVLAKAIQEQQAQIEALKKEIAQKDVVIADMYAKLATMKEDMKDVKAAVAKKGSKTHNTVARK